MCIRDSIKGEWWHVDDTDIEQSDCARDGIRPAGIIYMRQDKYKEFQKTELKKIKGIVNIGATLCWCNTAIQMLFSVPEIWKEFN